MVRIRASLDLDGLSALAAGQICQLIPDGQRVGAENLRDAATGALQRLEYCFSHVGNRYFFDGTSVVFDHLHGDQYASWLYLLANELHRLGGDAAVCKKLFLLNKALHGCDIFYEVELPSVFLLVHPLGTVLGRGQYADFFVAYQRCGIGSNHDQYPTISRHVTLRPGAAVLGRCKVGENCAIASESLLLDRDLAPDSVYIGNPRDFIVRPKQGRESIWRT